MITNVGAYLLGALDPADRAVVQAHLAGCPVCESELLRMAPLPGLLQRVQEADFAEPEPDAPITEPVPVAPAAPARRARLPVLVAAVAVVIALAGIVAAQTLGRKSDMVTWSAHDPASGIRAYVDLTQRPWGTELSIRMRDVPPGKPCKLVVRARDGSRETAGWWAAGTTAEEEIPGSTSFDLSAIAKVEVISGDNIVIDITPPD
ncbi:MULTISPECIES: anti-sigma factor family protein [Actinokineospora]|uniref:Anti-sigma-L factor RslA n=1 Tax=Actinokineospora fastidiosa TaxID=1816 RepID=A0A918LI89_9PSEU|nr:MULTISPECIES: zf-HC2 domain-containing protein [Actinokineospora]UVS81155.1 putative transmembrane transcriptional regulator (anti-sigma factor) [Actinokineospora sp. UTMC 2448]GGS51631.1 anti-sigma-L factor RslA [Actinokineospora fastidiosa]